MDKTLRLKQINGLSNSWNIIHGDQLVAIYQRPADVVQPLRQLSEALRHDITRLVEESGVRDGIDSALLVKELVPEIPEEYVR